MCSITSAPGYYLEFKSKCNRASVQVRQVCQGQEMVYSIGRETILVYKKSCALTKEQEKRKAKSDKLSVKQVLSNVSVFHSDNKSRE